jgi:hypothetical protein
MKNKSLFLTIGGIGLLLISFTLKPLGTMIFVPIVLGLIYLLFGFGIFKMGEKVKILITYTYFPVMTILFLMLNEFLENDPIVHNSKLRTFWYSSSGVCTEGTVCWFWGDMLLFLVTIISIILGIILLIRALRSNRKDTLSSGM